MRLLLTSMALLVTLLALHNDAAPLNTKLENAKNLLCGVYGGSGSGGIRISASVAKIALIQWLLGLSYVI